MEENTTSLWNIIFVTPFGFVCKLCSEQVASSQRALRRHLKHHGYTNIVHAPIHRALLNHQQEELRCVGRDWSYLRRFVTTTTKQGYACNCVIGHVRKWDAEKHVMGGKKKKCSATVVRKEELVLSVCGRFISITTLRACVNKLLEGQHVLVKDSIRICPMEPGNDETSWDKLPGDKLPILHNTSTTVCMNNPYACKDGNALGNGTNKITGVVIDYENEMDGPLLPPDHYPSRILKNEVDLGTTSTIKELRSLYHLQKGLTVEKRDYAPGALYKCIYPGHYTVDVGAMGCCDINLTIGRNTTSTVRIRTLYSAFSICSDIVCLGMHLGQQSGNCRRNCGDLGNMYALGTKLLHPKENYSVMSDDNVKMMYDRVKRMGDLVIEMMFPEEFHDMASAAHAKYASLLNDEEMKKCKIGASLMISQNLGNSAHKDSEDLSWTTVVFAEQIVNRAKNWYFIFPDASIDGSIGVIIKIYHGLMICWDGRVLSHCTSVTEPGCNNNVYGCAFGVFATKN